MNTDIQKQMADQAKLIAEQAAAYNKQMADWVKSAHTAGAKALSDMVAQTVSQPSVDAKTKAKLTFSAEQMISATNPKNFFAFNPEAMQKAIDTNGASVQQGIANLLGDMKKGSISMTDESAFEVGVNVGASEGAVVFENDLFQLIEYKPLTAKVFEKPFLLIPPCIDGTKNLG
jgi:polyhydroxyalkanoate synthase subunit PhaC